MEDLNELAFISTHKRIDELILRLNDLESHIGILSKSLDVVNNKVNNVQLGIVDVAANINHHLKDRHRHNTDKIDFEDN